jgi:hypothetical protein
MLRCKPARQLSMNNDTHCLTTLKKWFLYAKGYNLKRTETILAVEIGENKVQVSRFLID